MRYELTHDSLAACIEEMVSDEQKIRRKMNRFLEQQYARYETHQVLMNRDDLDYIRPYLHSLSISPSVADFVRKSENAVKRKGQIIAVSVAAIILVISALGIRAYLQGKRFEAQYLNAKARQVLGTDPTAALRLQENAYAIDDNPAIRQDMFSTYRKHAFYKTIIQTQGPVIAAARSADGSTIITVTPSQTEPDRWDEKGTKTSVLAGHIHPVYDLGLSESGEIATAGNDKTAILRDNNGNPTDTFQPQADIQAADIRALAIAPSGNRVVTGAADGTASLWLKGKTEPEFSFRTEYEISDVAAHPRMGSFSVAGNSPYLHFAWFTENGWKSRKIEGPGGEIRTIAYSPDEKYLVSGDNEGNLYLWESQPENLVPLRKIGAHRGAVTSLAFSSDMRWLVSGSADSTAIVWRLEDGSATHLRGHRGEIRSVHIDTHNTIMTAGLDSTVRVWTLPDPGPIFAKEDHSRGVTALAFSPDGKLIATGGNDHAVSLLDHTTMSYRWTHLHHREPILAVAVLAGGEVASVDAYGAFVRVDAENRAIEREFHAGESELLSAAFSADGKWLFTGGADSTARLWNIESGEEWVKITHRGLVFSVAFSPDGNQLLTGCEDSTAYLWDKTGRQLQAFKGHGGEVLSVGFTPRTATVITGSQDQTIRLWDKNGQVAGYFRDLAKPLKTLAVNPAETLLIAGYKDSRVILYDMEGYAIADIGGHKNFVNIAAFSPDGLQFATGSDDKYLRIWNHFRLPLADFLEKGILQPAGTEIQHLSNIP
ncbi:MAG: WD40 repeat domain-containing protein [Bacteroidia bacterium]